MALKQKHWYFADDTRAAEAKLHIANQHTTDWITWNGNAVTLIGASDETETWIKTHGGTEQ
jgi:hypothetical protein